MCSRNMKALERSKSCAVEKQVTSTFLSFPLPLPPSLPPSPLSPYIASNTEKDNAFFRYIMKHVTKNFNIIFTHKMGVAHVGVAYSPLVYVSLSVPSEGEMTDRT